MSQSRYVSTRGTVPWSGPRTPTSGYGKAEFEKKWHGPLAELHVRRSDDQLEELLAERLAQLRAKPPIGYPHPGQSTARAGAAR